MSLFSAGSGARLILKVHSNSNYSTILRSLLQLSITSPWLLGSPWVNPPCHVSPHGEKPPSATTRRRDPEGMQSAGAPRSPGRGGARGAAPPCGHRSRGSAGRGGSAGSSVPQTRGGEGPGNTAPLPVSARDVGRAGFGVSVGRGGCRHLPQVSSSGSRLCPRVPPAPRGLAAHPFRRTPVELYLR